VKKFGLSCTVSAEAGELQRISALASNATVRAASSARFASLRILSTSAATWLLVIASLWVGPAPMDLVFSGGLVATVLLSVLITGQVAGDGRSDWLRVVLLLAVYLIFLLRAQCVGALNAAPLDSPRCSRTSHD
jgi:hypothetical protein